MSNLGNPHGMRSNNKCIAGIQVKISSDTTLGKEAIGQHVKTIVKPKGISHLTWISIIVDPTPVPQIYSGLKCNGDSFHIQRGNSNGICPDNEIITRIQENLFGNAWEVQAIGKHVKTNGKPKGIRHLTRIPIVD